MVQKEMELSRKMAAVVLSISHLCGSADSIVWKRFFFVFLPARCSSGNKDVDEGVAH